MEEALCWLLGDVVFHTWWWKYALYLTGTGLKFSRCGGVACTSSAKSHHRFPFPVSRTETFEGFKDQMWGFPVALGGLPTVCWI